MRILTELRLSIALFSTVSVDLSIKSQLGLSLQLSSGTSFTLPITLANVAPDTQDYQCFKERHRYRNKHGKERFMRCVSMLGAGEIAMRV